MRKKGIAAFVIVLFFISSCSKPSAEPPIPSPPVDTVRVELNELIYAATVKGSVYAYNAADGKIKWSTNLFDGSINIGAHSSPTLVDGVLYICTPFSKVVALDAATGVIKWNRSIDNNPGQLFYSSPMVANNMLFVGHLNTFFAINTADGTIAWSHTKPGAIINQFDESSPCYSNGVVYVNCVNNAEQGLYGFNAITGAVMMQYPLNRPTVVSPCFANNAVYTATTSSDGSTGYILKLNQAGQPVTYPILKSARSSPTVFNSNIYIGSSNYLYSYTDTVSIAPLRWRFEAATDLHYSTPTADSNRVYIGSNDGTLYAVNDSSGIKEWEFKSNNRGLSSASSPTLANGAVYYCGIDGLYALNAKTGKLIWSNTESGGIYSSPCVIDKSGKVYHSGISGIKN
jgi:eukaryotic-like serine/threonine-protein kinase